MREILIDKHKKEELGKLDDKFQEKKVTPKEFDSIKKSINKWAEIEK